MICGYQIYKVNEVESCMCRSLPTRRHGTPRSATALVPLPAPDTRNAITTTTALNANELKGTVPWGCSINYNTGLLD